MTHTVIAVLEAIEGKESELQNVLEAVVEPSRSETTCLEYKFHKSTENPGQFIVYEVWESKEAHALQFEKGYIKDLVGKLEGLLGKPYQVFLAEEIQVSQVAQLTM